MARSSWHWLLLISCFGLAHGEYLGCYRDTEDGLMKGYLQNFVLTLTPDRCVDLCSNRGFKYAGLKSRIVCLCDSRVPPQRQRWDESLCSASCVGDTGRKCGGDEALSVYSTTLAQVSQPVKQKEPEEIKTSLTDSFIGCYVDSNKARLLTGYVQDLAMNIPEKCRSTCFRMGYLYSGVEYSMIPTITGCVPSKQCFCGDTPPPPSMLKDISQCSSPCPGDPAQKCGASARLAIFETGITDIPEVGKKMGCFDDEKPRVLDEYKVELEMTNSPRRCMNLCRSLNYAYSGVEYGKECFCGNTMKMSNTSRDTDDKECTTPCPGDVFQTCGNNWKLTIYRTGLADPTPATRKVGCYSTEGGSPLKGFRRDLNVPTSPEECTLLCYSKGFSYSAVIARTQCWCDDDRPPRSLSEGKDDCSETHAAVYRIRYGANPVRKNNYIGCFNSDQKGKVLGGFFSKFEGSLTPENCTLLCFNKGFFYSGVNNKQECHCGDRQLDDNSKVDDNMCTSPCPGDRSKYCGGTGSMNLYSTGIMDVPSTDKLIGCFKDEARPAILDGHKTDLEQTNSPRRCLNYCLQLNYMFAGVQYQKECYCGNSRPSALLDAPDGDCNSVCTGDRTETCGGGWRMAVYRTGYTPPSTDSEVPVSTTKPTDTCELSETVVKGKRVCKGAIVFKDSFTTNSIADQWQHTIKLGEHPDYEFVTFTSDPANSFQKDGKLTIKPTILPDQDVQEGHISLDGCTGLAGTRECDLVAFSYNILPPVRSARIHTHRSFSFRYGVVEIRARLPAGDWLVPELWLLPQDQSYGSNYLSGKIRVAMSRGNRYLTFDGKDIGSSTLESGVLVGTESNVTARSVINKISDSWSSHTHNYTLIWTPDNLSFYVDGQAQQALLPPHITLVDLLGLNKTDNTAWGAGSRIAPFDTEFYFSLGVSAGGYRDFPDDCVSKDRVKPWKNFKLKAMLNFWLARDTWRPSWDDNKSSLIVEEVRVTAL